MHTSDTLKSVDAILHERGEVYGSFEDNARTSQSIKSALSAGKFPGLVQQESMDMIANKLARISNGAANHIDTWKDIAGYATLVVEYLQEQQSSSAA